MMRQIHATTSDGLDGIKVVRIPLPPPPSRHQVRVSVKAAGINFFDLYSCLGLSPDTAPPCPLGLEAAGVIDAVGEDTILKVGERVVVHCPKGGAFSDVVTVDDDQVMLLPDAVTFEAGAAITVSYLTAFFALHYAGCLRENGSVFIHSAAGSVGWAATQLAKQVPGVTVLGTASAAKMADIAGNGVDHPINHEQDYLAVVQQLRPDGVSLVLDCLAGQHFASSQAMLAPFGKVVLIGAKDMIAQSGTKVIQTDPVSPFDLIMKNIGVTGLHLSQLQKKSPALFCDTWRELLQLAAAEKITPRIFRTFPMTEAAEACRQLKDRLNVGKVVLYM